MKKYLKLVSWIASVAILYTAVGFIFKDAMQVWYPSLNQPAYVLPPIVEMALWYVFYVVIGFLGYKIWAERNWEYQNLAKQLFIAHAVLIILWYVAFCGMKHLMLAAAVWAVTVAVASVLYNLLRKQELYSWLMLPYLAYGVFALYGSWQLICLN